MYAELYEYLILNRQLSVPGIGTFFLERKASETDLSHRQINAPGYSIVLKNTNSTPAKKLFYWLAERLHISYHEAIMQFNSFAIDLKNQLIAGHKVEWANVGTLSKWITHEIRFESAVQSQQLDPPVSATKIIRDKAEHIVRVGEEEKTSTEMSELLNESGAAPSHWWAIPLIVGIVLIIILGIYFSQQGISSQSTGTQQRLNPATSDSTYKLQP